MYVMKKSAADASKFKIIGAIDPFLPITAA